MKQLVYALDQILYAHWMISHNYVVARLPLLQGIVEGIVQKNLSPDLVASLSEPSTLPIAAYGTSPESREYFKSFDESTPGSVSIIRLQGPLMKQDSWQVGTASLKNYLRDADRHENIVGHILHIDSPGGTVDGTKDLADAVRSAQKPIVAFVDGLGGSAAYWVMSGAKEIIASNETTMIGSIGTMLSFMDFRGFFEEKLGAKFHDIVATESYEKNETFYEALKGNYKPVIKEMLDPMNEIFLAAVRENRPGVNEKALHGKVYLAADAIKMGIADSIGDFDYAMQRVAALLKNKNTEAASTVDRKQETASVSLSQSPDKQKPMFGTNKKFAALIAAFTAIATLPEGQAASEEQINAINDELNNLGMDTISVVANSQLDEFDAQMDVQTRLIASLNAELATAKAAQASAEAEAATQKALAEKYGAQPGVMHTDPSNGQGDMIEEDENEKLINSLPHNIAVDGNTLFNQNN